MHMHVCRTAPGRPTQPRPSSPPPTPSILPTTPSLRPFSPPHAHRLHSLTAASGSLPNLRTLLKRDDNLFTADVFTAAAKVRAGMLCALRPYTGFGIASLSGTFSVNPTEC